MSNLSPATPEPENQSLTEFERNILEKEYFFLQTTIEDYNKQIWVIKALGITGTGAILALMLQQKTNGSAIALIGCAIPVFFWILESQWKYFQRGFYPRVAEIESILSNHGLRCPCIYGGWTHAVKHSSYSPKRSNYLKDGLLNPSVYVSYVL
ncbi:hypothetical protein [Brasilonema bromeliae]|uniref:Uncharacterized protein n=1 Tax=Brasilonema bromeliae SPC951 TaxID=385972 RepID=A0ABX1PEA4_9CYAN|nr:hypothetical protein [Brasilonema bromeliae]NMG22117.1 hypothetical protein [Brasilonema bromeliae SPC951]